MQKNTDLFGFTGTKEFTIGIIFIFIISYLVIFLHLGTLTLRTWDESTYLFNTENMLNHPDLVMVYDFNNKPELFSPKPPFYIWISTISVKLLPQFPELAIRLPSAFFALFTIILIYCFVYFYLKNFGAALLSAIVLLSSIGYFQWHIVRTGDTDSTFVFWCIFCCINFFIYTNENGTKQNKALILSGIGLFLATMTKGPGIIVLLPSLFLWLIISKKLIYSLKQPLFWVVFASIFIFIFSWYFTREQLNQGFLNAVWQQELRGRFESIEPQTHPENHAIYYLYRLFDEQYFMPWILLLLPSLFIVLRQKVTVEIKFIRFILLVWIFCLASMAKTVSAKDWYDALWYPLMAFLTGICLTLIIKQWSVQASRTVFFAVLILAIWPLSIIVKKNLYEKETQNLKPFLEKLRSETFKNKKVFVYDQEFDPALFYYIRADNKKGFKSEIWNKDLNLLPDNIDIITINLKNEKELLKIFDVNKVAELKECKLFHINGHLN